jgi:hypothetical protein
LETALQYDSAEYQPLTSLSTGAKSKPFVDEAGFQQLLAAAYVLQQHNDTVRAKDPRLDTAWIFSQIAETQSQVREGGMDISAAMGLLVDRLRKVTDSSGVSISLLIDGTLNCAAESGVAAPVRGGSIASNSLVANERVRNGREFHSSDAQGDTRLDIVTCRELGVGSLLAVPIQRSEEIAGLIELRWSKADGFHECDVRTCELMAALVTEILDTKEAEPERVTSVPPILKPWPDTRIIPELQEIISNQTLQEAVADSASVPEEEISGALAAECRVCGRPFGADEAFCGNCSMPRVAVSPTENLQSKWASMWFMQQAQETLQEREMEAEPPSQVAPQAKQYPEFQAIPEISPPEIALSPPPVEPAVTGEPSPQALSIWVHQEREHKQREVRVEVSRSLRRVFDFVRMHLRMPRRAVHLAIISSALFALFLLWSIRPAGDPSHLTWFESLLVEFGLAEVPQQRQPAYTGVSDIRVWVDVHTALYYCPGSDLYGKTPGGHFSTQGAAQEDQFEPATRAACE